MAVNADHDYPHRVQAFTQVEQNIPQQVKQQKQKVGEDPHGTTKEPALDFVMDRVTAHKVLAMLQEKAEEAGWDLPKPSGWTDKLQQANASKVN